MNSSLFFVFDRNQFTEIANRLANGDNIDLQKAIEKGDVQDLPVDVKMIDIGRMEDVVENETQDVGFIKGLEELIKLLTDIKHPNF